MTTLVGEAGGLRRRAAARHAAASRVSAGAALAVARGVAASVALLALWLAVFGGPLSALQEARDQRVLYAQLRQQLAEATAPVSAPVRLGAPVALVSVPAIGLHHLVVVQGTAAGELASGPGHRTDTVLPGQAGISVVQGRAASFGGPFARVPRLRRGETIAVVTGQGRFTYVVERFRRAGDPVPPPARGTGRLTLVTGEGSGGLGRWAPQDTLYVDAALAKPAPAGRVDTPQAGGAPMATSTASVVPLVLWLELLAGAALGLVWAARRWGGPQTWCAGGAALLAVLWGASHAAWALLPNLL